MIIRHENGHLTNVVYNASVYKDAGGDVIGALAIGIGILGLMRTEPRLLGRITVVIGLWLIASAAFLEDSSDVRVNCVLMGGIFVILALVGMAAQSDRQRGGESIS